MKPNHRFIAGANCPQCNQMDSLLLNLDDESISCVDCDYKQSAQQRDKQQTEQPQTKTAPKKVDVSNIIRVNNLPE